MRTVIRSWRVVIMAVVTLFGLCLPAGAADAARTLSAAVQAACPQQTAPGMATCTALVSDAQAGGTGVQATPPSGYAPANLQAAYGLQSPTEGMRQTVAVIAAGGDPEAESDLAVYRSQYGLSPCTTGDGCLKTVNQTGGATLPPVDTGSTPQIATDLEMVSAVCPNCHILLVEANDAYITDLGTAVNEAVTLGAKIVNVSYGGPEQQTETTWDASYFSHPGVAITAAAGNGGYTGGALFYPAASPDVIAVGGTTLDKAGTTGCTTGQAGTRGWCETAWAQTTSGCSEFESKPKWQGATKCAGRADNDLAAVASSNGSPSAPIAYYNTADGATGWGETGGTGAAAPIVAGIYADAGTPAAGGNPAAYPYQHPGGGYINPNTAYPYSDGLNDITSGTNNDGGCSISDLCTAGSGWDGPTGLGSPAGTESLTPTGATSGPIYADQFNMCLDDSGGTLADDNKVQVFSCNGDSHSQTWTAEADGTIHLGSSAYCLDLIFLYSCDGNPYEQWRIRSNGELVNEASGYCLEDPSGGTAKTMVNLATCTGSYDQQWAIPYPVPPSTGEIISQADTSKCVDNQGGTLSAGNKIQIYDCNGGADAQNWTLAADGTIRVGSSWCMTAGFFIVALEQCNGSPAQFWAAASDGSLYNFAASYQGATPSFPGTTVCLDAPSTTNGTELEWGGCNASAAEHWKLPLP